MKLKKILAGFLAFVMVATSAQLPAMQAKAEEKKDDLKIWYDSPAGDSYTGWEQWALPIGNSGIGASVFGGITQERIQLNEKSLWSGGPADQRPNYMGGNIESQGQNGEVMKRVQELMAAGQTSAAVQLCNQLVGVSDDAGTQGYGYYLSYGNMYLDFAGVTAGNVTNYYRDLDLRTAIATVEYDYNGTHYTRESFVSYPDNVLVTQITADGTGDIDVEIAIEPDNVKGSGSNNPGSSSYTREWTTTVDDGMISIQGELDDNQMKFVSHTQVVADGTVTDKTETVSVADAKTVTIITSIATDYKNEYPEYRTGETDAQLSARVENYVAKAAAKTYETLKDTHVADYDNIFGRVELNIGQEVSDKTTNKLLAAYQNGSATEAEKRYLEVMMFQYGRYLTIEASRETPEDDPYRESLPTNLQGMWVGANNSAWHSDYHMNVNLQMNYWPTYSTNMAECAEPLINYVESLREPGRVTAKIYAGIESTSENPENGFMAHTQNNPFGWTCPGWSFDWGWSPAGVPWILQNCWEYYEYTGDKAYMEEMIYPMLKEEAVFYDQFLVRNADGELVSSPSYSPEHGPRTEGNTYEHSLIWQLYEDAMTAAEILGKDEALVEKWAKNQADLKGPIEIGDSGQIKEWYHETTLGSVGDAYGHRHISHMLGLFPGDLIQKNDEWVEAAKVSMAARTDNTTGWAQAQRVCTWARLENGNRAYKVLNNLISTKIMTNLWDTHAPYQIDGNYGLTAGVAEMLLQSNMGFIDLLPAVPDTWADGTVEGLLARGNFEVDMTWANTSLKEATIHSKNGGTCIVDYATIADAVIVDEDGKEVEVTKVDDTRVSFETEKGATYTIKDVPEKPLESLEIEGRDTINLNVINTAQLEAVYEPAFCAANGVTWSVDNEKVATIDENGLLTAKRAGTVVVTATYNGDNTTTATKTIEIVWGAPVADVAFDQRILAKNAIANSEMNPESGSDGPASWAFDDEDHWWHSRWGNWGQLQPYETVTQSMTGKPSASNPIWIQTGFDQVYYIDHIDYTPRGNGFGIFKDYTVSVANLADPTATPADSDFEVVKSGTLAGVTTTQTIQLDNLVAATHVRITMTSVTCAGDGHIAGKKIDIYGFDALPADKAALANAINTASELAEKDYTEDSWTALEEALAAAEGVLAAKDSTQEDIDAAAEILNAAIKALVEKPAEDEVTRISGKDRYATGYKAAEALKEALGVDKFDAVVVATGKNFADALSGSYLAIVKEAPILLTNGKDDNVAELHAYIKDNVNAGGKVYILGGTAAVPAAVEEIEGYTVKRLAGSTRYETNLDILAEAGITGTELLVATGKEFADSLSASAAGRPILLVKPGAALSAEQKAIAETVKGGNIYIVGGTGAVADTTAAELEAYATVERIAGSGRQETSKKIAEKFFADAETVVLANAKNFPDGLCGGPLAAAMNAPLLLTAIGNTTIAEGYVQGNALTTGVVLGGTGALSDEAVVDVFGLESADEIVLK